MLSIQSVAVKNGSYGRGLTVTPYQRNHRLTKVSGRTKVASSQKVTEELLLLLDPNAVTYDFRSLHIGHMSSPKQSKGRMRDKECSHSKVFGELEVLPILGSSAPTNTPTSFAEGRKFAFGSTPFSHFIPWGKSMRVGVAEFDVYSTPTDDDNYYVGRTRKYCDIQFYGNYMVQINFTEGCRMKAYSHSSDSRVPGKDLTKAAGGQVSVYERRSNTACRYWATSIYIDDSLNLDDPEKTKYSTSVETCRFRGPGTYLDVKSLLNAYKTATATSFPSYIITAGVDTQTQASLKEEVDYIEYICRLYASSVISRPNSFDYSSLTTEIISQQKFIDANLLLSCFELGSFGDILKTVADIPGLLTTLKDLPTKASNLYLAYIYGVKPSISDAKAVVEGVDKLGGVNTSTRYHSSQTLDISIGAGLGREKHVMTAEVASLPDELCLPMQVIKGWKQWGMYPSFSMFWDAVPFSFVADWFVNIQSLAEAADARIDKEYFPVAYVITSMKREVSVVASRLFPQGNVQGAINFSFYERKIAEELPLPPLQIGETSGSFTHWAESGALIIQMK